YYGNRDLSGVTAVEAGGCRFVTATLTRSAGHFQIAAAVDIAALPLAVSGMAGLAGERPTDADLYVAWEGQPDDADAMAAQLGETLPARPLPKSVARITVIVPGPSGAVIQHHFTFRPAGQPAGRPAGPGVTGGAELAEDRLIRGLHPQIARRLQLQRL